MSMQIRLKIGEAAAATGVTPKALRYYERLGLFHPPLRTQSHYRLYSQEDIHKVEFIKKAKRLGLSLEEIRGILAIHAQKQTPCVHVLALLDQKLAQIEGTLKDLKGFQRELKRLKTESQERLAELPKDARICGIIERGVHLQGEAALSWLDRQTRVRRRRTAFK